LWDSTLDFVVVVQVSHRAAQHIVLLGGRTRLRPAKSSGNAGYQEKSMFYLIQRINETDFSCGAQQSSREVFDENSSHENQQSGCRPVILRAGSSGAIG
jgi:hypothetical protein